MAKPVITDKPIIDQAEFNGVTIWRKEGGSIEVSDTNYPSMKAALQDIAAKAGIKLEEGWNTQYMGWYIIQQLKKNGNGDASQIDSAHEPTAEGVPDKNEETESAAVKEVMKDDIARAIRVALKLEDCEDAFVKIGDQLVDKESVLSIFFYEQALETFFISGCVDRNSICYEDLLRIAGNYIKVVKYLNDRAKEIVLRIASESNDSTLSSKSAIEFLKISKGEDWDYDSEIIKSIVNNLFGDCEDVDVLRSLYYISTLGEDIRFKNDQRKSKVLLHKILSKSESGEIPLRDYEREYYPRRILEIESGDLNVIVGKDENLREAVSRILPHNITEYMIWRLTISGDLKIEDLYYIDELATHNLWYLDIRNVTINQIDKRYYLDHFVRRVRYVVVPIALVEFAHSWENERIIIPKEINNIFPGYFCLSSVKEIEVEWTTTPPIPYQYLRREDQSYPTVIIPNGTKQLFERAGWNDTIEKQNEYD